MNHFIIPKKLFMGMEMLENNNYSKMQKDYYNKGSKQMSLGNHKEHNENPDYFKILLGDINSSYDNKKALDFGCGCGRNLLNLAKLAKWKRIDGCDISNKNLEYTKNNLEKENILNFKLYENNGIDLNPIESNTYDFIMSTIVFTHICVYDIRLSLLKDIYRVLKPNGLFSFQMSFGKAKRKAIGYYENYYDATSTNGNFDVELEKEEYLLRDLQDIGYTIKEIKIRESFSDNTHPNWIYIKATKLEN